MSVVAEIKCSHCGAPIPFQPGELIATCKYCGYTVAIETGQAFTFDHSMLLNKYDPAQIEQNAKEWMREGFMKPSDLAKKSKIDEKNLIYVPFWVVSVKATSSYKGIFERITPAMTKEGKIEREYDWLVLARKATQFPTRDYEVPLTGKIPFDFRRIEAFANVLNSEVDKDAAVEFAKQQIEENNRFLIQQDVDKVIEMKTDMDVHQVVYLHSPIWFLKYEYKGKLYQLLIDGAGGSEIRGDIPSAGF